MPTVPMRHRCSFLVLVGLIASALAFAQPSALAQTPGDAPPSITEYPCPFETFGDRTVTCGEIEVPLDRDVLEGLTMVTVPFAVYQTNSANPKPDPIVYIDGGPGGSTLASLGPDPEFFFGELLADRDLVLFDQRGTGFSEPSIRCPETFAAFSDQGLIDAMAECGERLVTEGIDVSKFATDDVVLDLEDLRLALGYQPWNLYGISYGTTVALASVRDLPDSARTIVLDSSYPQGLNTDGLVPSAAHAFAVLAAGCNEQKGCRKNHRDVADGFVDLIAELNANPAMVPVYDFDNRRQLIPLTGTELAGFVFQLMYSVDALAWLPRLIAETADGDYTMIANALGAFDGDGPGGDPEEIDRSAFVQERYLATECNERYSFLTRADMAVANSPHPDIWPAFYSTVDDDRTFSICEVFGSGSAPLGENDQIFSDVPSLVLAGSYDPITPPSWGQYAASGLSSSAFHELPSSSHGVAPGNVCGSAIMVAFLNDPTGSEFGGGCETTETNIGFQNSRGASRVVVRNATFRSEGYRIRTKAPRNWTAFGGNIRLRDNGPLDSNTALLVIPFTSADNRKQAVREIKDGFLKGTKLVNRGTRTTGVGEWEMFAAEEGGSAFDFALVEIGGDWFGVLLVSEPDERKRLRRLVLNKSLKRFKVQGNSDAQSTTDSGPLDSQVFADLVTDTSDFADLWAEVQKISGPVVDVQIGTR